MASRPSLVPHLQFTRNAASSSSVSHPRETLVDGQALNSSKERTWKHSEAFFSSSHYETRSTPTRRPETNTASWKHAVPPPPNRLQFGRIGGTLSLKTYTSDGISGFESSRPTSATLTQRHREPLSLGVSSKWASASVSPLRFGSRNSTTDISPNWRTKTPLWTTDATDAPSRPTVVEPLDETLQMKETMRHISSSASLDSNQNQKPTMPDEAKSGGSVENPFFPATGAEELPGAAFEFESGQFPHSVLWRADGGYTGKGGEIRSVSEEERLLEDQWKSEVAQRITLDAEPLVPPAILRRAQVRTHKWRRHPSHIIVLFLLQRRGLYYPRNRDIYNYHMASSFLHYLDICREGSYFVHYTLRRWPKERFFRIRLCATDWYSEENTNMLPFLVTTVHKSGVTIVKSLPLHQLVGVSLGADGPVFTPLLCGGGRTIQGCMDSSGHRATFPTAGAFRLQFYDEEKRTTESVDLLTCDPKVFDIWTKTFSGIVSVNSSSVIQVPLTEDGYNTQEREAMRRVVIQRTEEEALRSR